MKTSMFSGFSRFCADLGTAGAVQYAKSLGFDGVEPYPGTGFRTPEDAEALAHILKEEGMEAPCVSLCVDLHGAAAKESIETLKRLSDLTAAVGAPQLHHTLVPGLHPAPLGTPSFEDMFSEVVENAAEVAAYANSLGLRVIYEDQGFLFNGADRFARFLAAMKGYNVGVCADFGNIFFVGETPERFIGCFSNQIFHVHVKDYLYKPATAPFPGKGWLRDRDGGYLRDTVPGHGIVNMVGCLSILRGAGYDGFFSFEFGGPEPYDVYMPRALENLRRYEELAALTL